MGEIVRQIFIIPFLLLAFFTDVVGQPNRVFQGSGAAVAEPAGSWQTSVPLPSSRYDFGAGVFEGKIYIVGGLVHPSPWFPTRLVEAYDETTKSWSKLKDYPKLVHHEGVVGCGKSLYVIGGYWLRVFSSAYVYANDAKSDGWIRKADLPNARGALGTVCVDNKIYAIGGSVNTHAVSFVDVYDVDSNTWTSKSSMPRAREHAAVVTAGGRIFVLGGHDGNRFKTETTNEIYDPKTDTWRTGTPIPLALNGLSAVALGNSIFIFGGANGDAVSNEVHEYRIAQDRWVRRADLPVGRYGFTALPLGNTIHVIGGNSVVKGNYFNLDHRVFIP